MNPGMQLTVLGSSASCPAPGDACSGYLVSQGNTQLLIDCGSGVLGKLFQHTTIDAISAILISHFHPDHFLDLITLRYGLRYGHSDAPRPLVLLPPGGVKYLENLGRALRGTSDYFTSPYHLEEYDPAMSRKFCDLKVDFCRTDHDIPTYAMSVEGSGRLVYSSDTSPSQAVEDFATGANLFLCESTYPADPDGITTYNHLTSVQAAGHAANAKVDALVLTHFWPDFSRNRYREEAQEVFSGPVYVAEPGMCYQVSASPKPHLREQVGLSSSKDQRIEESSHA